jgi:hypothetical protein
LLEEVLGPGYQYDQLMTPTDSPESDMEPVFIIATIVYMFSCACYFGYLFFQKDRLQKAAVGLMTSRRRPAYRFPGGLRHPGGTLSGQQSS